MIYEVLLREKFQQLHPKLQHRYALPLAQPFYAQGVMHTIENGSALFQPVFQLGKHIQFLFPETGENIPFTLKNTYTKNELGEHIVTFERLFYFPEVTRAFHTTMRVDLQQLTARDYLGSPPLVSAELVFEVTQDGALITKSGAQKLVVFGKEFPLPSLLGGSGNALEGYDTRKNVFTIEVTNYNAALGKIVNYLGEFVETEAF